MKIIDKITNQEIQTDYPNTIRELKNYFACHSECQDFCPDSHRVEVWRDNGVRVIRKLCELTIKQ